MWEERRENRIDGHRMELLMFESCDCLTYGKNMYFKILHGRILHSELTVVIQEYWRPFDWHVESTRPLKCYYNIFITHY